MISRCRKCGFLAAVVWGMGSIAAAQPAATRPLEIYFIDVAGGAATLLVTPERESVLIDSGWPGLNDRDPKRIVHALKDLAGCDQLDHLVTTHWHADHFGGVAGLARHDHDQPFLGPRSAGGRGFPAGFPRRAQARRSAGNRISRGKRGKRKALRAGDSLPLEGSASSSVWHRAAASSIRPPSASTRLTPPIARIRCANVLRPTGPSTRQTTHVAWRSCSRWASFSFSTPAT